LNFSHQIQLNFSHQIQLNFPSDSVEFFPPDSVEFFHQIQLNFSHQIHCSESTKIVQKSLRNFHSSSPSQEKGKENSNSNNPLKIPY
jgi:hypothetical protein